MQFYSETVGSHSSSDRNSLHVAMQQSTLKSRENLIVIKADHTSGSNSQAFGNNCSLRTSQSNRTTRRNSPLRQTS